MPETPSPPRSIDETVLMRLEPIAALSPERVRELAALCYPETVPAGGTLFREGERDGRAVFLLRGEVRLSSAVAGLNRTVRAGTPETRAPLPGEALPGSEARHALADKQPRQATAVAETDVEVLPIDGELLEIMLTWDQLLASQARLHAARRVDGPEQSMAVILQSLAFRNLPPARIDQLAARLERTPVEAGQVLIREGEEGDYYYLIERGTAEVARAAPGGGRSRLAELGRGGAFGEEALASGARRNATVTMKTDGVLWRLAKQDFIELLRAPLLNWVSREQAAAKVRSDDARWLDVRHPAEYAFARVPGGIVLPAAGFAQPGEGSGSGLRIHLLLQDRAAQLGRGLPVEPARLPGLCPEGRPAGPAGRRGRVKPAADGLWMPARRGVQCPYCGERFEAFPDGSGGDQEYIEDCRVCCRPIRFRLRTDAAGNVLAVEVDREDD